MHYVTLGLPFQRTPTQLLPAGRWLCEDVTAAEILSQAERGITYLDIAPTWFLRLATKHFHATPRNILLISNAGFGDVLLCTPALRAFRVKFPQHTLTLCCPEKTHCLFDGVPYAPKLIPYPVPAEVAEEFDGILTTEHLQEAMLIGREKPAVDIKADVLGVGPLKDEEREVDYFVSLEEQAWAIGACPKIQMQGGKSKHRIGIHLNASGPTRTPHPQWMTDLIVDLYENEDYEILLIGTVTKMEVPAVLRDRVRDTTHDGLTFRQSAALVATCDVLVAPDSAMIHVAGALRIPAVGVFAVVPWELRTADYPTVRVLQGHAACSPCFWHPRSGGPLWPPDMPCAKTGFCLPLSEIKVDRVVREVGKMTGKHSCK